MTELTERQARAICEARFSMRVADDLLVKVEEWRRSQAIIPSRSAAIRYLVERGLSSLQRAAEAKEE